MIVFEHWFNYTTPLNFTLFKGIIKAFSGICVPLTSITFPVIWSSVFVWRYCGVVTFFRINNTELKCSFVQCRKYHNSWWNGAAELHISADLLCGITAAELHNSVDLLWHYGCLATSALARTNGQPRKAGVARGVRGHAPPPPRNFEL